MKVNTRFLKEFFLTARSIFTGYEDGKVIYAEIKDSHLRLSLETDISYCVTQPIAADSDTAIAVLFKDITELLPDTGDVDLVFLPTCLEISNPTFKANLLLAYGAFKHYEALSGNFKPLDRSEFWSASKRVSMSQDFARIYHRTSPVICTGTEAQVLFPTVQVATPLNGIQGIITPRALKLLSQFSPTGVRQEDRVWEFTDGSAFMSIISAPDNEARVLPIDGELVGLVNGEFLELASSAISKVLGDISVDVLIYTSGTRVIAKTADVQTKQDYGEIAGKPLLQFKIAASWLHTVAKIFGKENFKVSRKENAVWFVDNSTRMIVAVT